MGESICTDIIKQRGSRWEATADSLDMWELLVGMAELLAQRLSVVAEPHWSLVLIGGK